jgi:hypothetical protein
MTETSVLSSRFEEKAICEPSGEKTGYRAAAPPVSIRVSPEPSALTTKIP